MEPSTRTPEGEPNRCPVCGKSLRIEPSRPLGDAPCPHCGHLLWFEPKKRDPTEEEPVKQESGVLELVELVSNKLDKKEMAKAEANLRKGEFTLEDFKRQLSQIRNLGRIQNVMAMIPGIGGMSEMLGDQIATTDFCRLTGIIDSMTPDERRNPLETVDQGRRCRIATGAGVEPHEVSELVKQFCRMADLMKTMAKMGMLDRMRLMRNLRRRGMFGS